MTVQNVKGGGKLRALEPVLAILVRMHVDGGVTRASRIEFDEYLLDRCPFTIDHESVDVLGTDRPWGRKHANQETQACRTCHHGLLAFWVVTRMSRVKSVGKGSLVFMLRRMMP